MVIVRDEDMETMRKVQCTLYIIVFVCEFMLFVKQKIKIVV